MYGVLVMSQLESYMHGISIEQVSLGYRGEGWQLGRGCPCAVSSLSVSFSDQPLATTDQIVGAMQAVVAAVHTGIWGGGADGGLPQTSTCRSQARPSSLAA